ncbi:VOC family protein [Candidatus Bathyarchaeota archaeon]|nr:VOC family protein [Candidatus Bathyarchaeota archaeon]
MNLSEIEGQITFTYYNDLEAAAEFYGDVMGFELVIDVGFAKVYRVYGETHVGIVDGNLGSIKAAEEKPVMISFIVDDIESWHGYLKERGVDVFQPPKEAAYLKMKTMLFRDPEGYVLEVLEFLTPYGL